MNLTINKRNITIDLLRIISTVFVICIHVIMNYREIDGQVIYSVLFIEGFLRCCVPIFLMITGFFVFNSKKSTQDILKGVFKNIIMPTLATLLLLQIFDNYLHNRSTFIDCIIHFNIDWRDLLSHLVKFSSGSKNAFYLWYIFSLINFYIWFPLLKYICQDSKETNIIRRTIMVLAFLSHILLPTLYAIAPRFTDIILIPSILPDHFILYSLIGYEFSVLYRKYENIFQQKKSLILSLSLYIAGTFLSFFLTIYFDILSNHPFFKIFYGYNMLGVFIQAIGLFAFFLSLNPLSFLSEKSKNCISSLGQKMFYVYLIHWPFILKHLRIGIVDYLNDTYGTIALLAFTLYAIIACFLIAILLDRIIRRINLLFTKNATAPNK